MGSNLCRPYRPISPNGSRRESICMWGASTSGLCRIWIVISCCYWFKYCVCLACVLYCNLYMRSVEDYYSIGLSLDTLRTQRYTLPDSVFFANKNLCSHVTHSPMSDAKCWQHRSICASHVAGSVRVSWTGELDWKKTHKNCQSENLRLNATSRYYRPTCG